MVFKFQLGMQEFYANLALAANHGTALAIQVRGRCCIQRRDFFGAREDFRMLKSGKGDVQEVYLLCLHNVHLL